MNSRSAALRDGAVRAVLIGLMALLALSAAWALWSPTKAQSPRNGSFIREIDTNDIYRVQIQNGKRFKRLMLNPAAFCAYADVPANCESDGSHWLWRSVVDISSTEMLRYTTSTLARLGSKRPVHHFYTTGEDSGMRRHLNINDTEFERTGLDRDSVFRTEPGDFYAYDEDTDPITCSDLSACAPSPITSPVENRPPVINVQASLTLIEGQPVSDLRIATVTDPDDTLAPESMDIYGLQGGGWRATYDQTSGDLSISGTAPSRTASPWAMSVEVTDGESTTEQAFQITILGDGSSGTPTSPANTNVALDYDDGGGCQLSNTDGRGQPSYQPGQELLLSCPVTNTYSELRYVDLDVELQHNATGRQQLIFPDGYLKASPHAERERHWVRFAIPADWPNGDTTATAMLYLWEMAWEHISGSTGTHKRLSRSRSLGNRSA